MYFLELSFRKLTSHAVRSLNVNLDLCYFTFLVCLYQYNSRFLPPHESQGVEQFSDGRRLLMPDCCNCIDWRCCSWIRQNGEGRCC